jgi:hypothetical protein
MYRFASWTLVFAAVCVPGGSAVVPQDTRVEILKAMFPKSDVEVVKDQRLKRPSADEDSSHKDVFQSDPVYSVTAPALGKDEICAASDVLNEHRISDHRELRFRVFWLSKVSAVFSIAQYAFVGANPPGACPSLARVDYLRTVGSQWVDVGHAFLDSTHHTAIQSVQLLDLHGADQQELHVESNFGGACATGSDLTIFAVVGGHLKQVLSVPLRFETCYPSRSRYEQKLDVERTIRSRDKYCFSKKTYIKGAKRFNPPITTFPCYNE